MSVRRLLPLVAVWTVAVLWAYLTVTTYAHPALLGEDARAYWLAARADDLYAARAGERDAFLYTPLFAQLVALPALLPWPAFLTLWCGVEAAAFVWLLRPWGWRWGVPAFAFCLGAVLIGNVFGVLAVAAVLGARPGARWGAAWSYGLLTKVTPGLCGLAFLLGARRWRALGWALGVAAALALVSYAVAPGDWAAWWDFLRTSPTDASVRIRTGLALLIGLAAGLLGRPWLVAIALAVASPNLGGAPALAVLAALPRLLAPPVSEPAAPRPAPSAGSR